MPTRTRHRSRSTSQQRQHLLSKFQGSPSRTRVTRSRSREVGGLHIDSNRLNVRPSSRDQSKVLDPVVEEAPSSPLDQTGARDESAAAPEPDVADITGTTFIPDSETDLDPEMMLEAFPDLERTGKSVLDFLAPTTASPAMIVNKADLLIDPKNTQSKRLLRLIKNLDGDMKIFSNQTYIDLEGINRIFSAVLEDRREDIEDWSPDPIVQMANCARFALEILLAGTNPNSRKRAIRDIEKLFPRPFMTGIVGAGQDKAPGESLLDKETFDLALSIRTQSLIMLLEEKQEDPKFNAKHAVKLCFFKTLSRKSPMRGFNLPNFSNKADGNLPAQYMDDVRKRYNDILLVEEDGKFDVNELKQDYRWKRFVLHSAHWVRRRTDEIYAELQQRMSTQTVHYMFFNAKNSSLTSTLGGSEVERIGGIREADEQTTRQENVPREITTRQESVTQETFALPVPVPEPEPEPEPQQPESRPDRGDMERRRSSRPSYLNPTDIQRLVQRQERLRAENKPSEIRGQPDIVYPPSPNTNERYGADGRPSSSASPSSHPVQQDLSHPHVLPFDDEPTLVPDEPELNLSDDSELANGDESSQIEGSHSPSVVPRSTPWAQEPTSTARTTGEVSVTDYVWDAHKRGASVQPTPGPSRNVASRFIDRQRNAERVSPIRDGDSQSAVTRVEERASRKRARPSTETDSDDDSSNFDFDNRQTDIERRRAEKPQRPRSKQPRLAVAGTQSEASADAHRHHVVEVLAQPVRQRTVLPPTTSTQAPAARHASKARSSWTDAEDNRLIRLMKDHGHKWSLLEKHNKAQPARQGEVRIEGRGQVAFKDRARNLKIAYYRDGIPIPDYLEYVTMKEKDVKGLLNRGVTILPYDMEVYNRAQGR
ncbi:hypothetical protein BDW74DRAFT_127800 [Aspergillus multicolor]|uniref:uncharacterized protein n=1 Tax=Aspergillus multicolor TaxID=41759 RepID=UPI003CCC910D